jgi:hypothetical protein
VLVGGAGGAGGAGGGGGTGGEPGPTENRAASRDAATESFLGAG